MRERGWQLKEEDKHMSRRTFLHLAKAGMLVWVISAAGCHGFHKRRVPPEPSLPRMEQPPVIEGSGVGMSPAAVSLGGATGSGFSAGGSGVAGIPPHVMPGGGGAPMTGGGTNLESDPFANVEPLPPASGVSSPLGVGMVPPGAGQ
jgi:hypothetical protein